MFVVGGKIQKFLRESILDPKVSRETCWRCCTRENVRMLGILLGLNPGRFKVEQAFILEEFGMQHWVKNKVHQAQLWPPRGALGGQLALLAAPDNTETAEGGLACSEWVNICRPQTAIQICRGGIGWLGPGRLPSWRVTGYNEVTGNKSKHREMAEFGRKPLVGEGARGVPGACKSTNTVECLCQCNDKSEASHLCCEFSVRRHPASVTG